MKAPVFFLTQHGKSEQVGPLSDLRRMLEKSSAETGPGVITLELRKGVPPRPWEKFVYPLLGLKIPITSTSLTIYWVGVWAFATFEDNDQEWVAHLDAQPDGEKRVQFRTEAGESFPVQAQDCIPKEHGFRLLEDFFQVQKKPAGIKWIKSGTQKRPQ